MSNSNDLIYPSDNEYGIPMLLDQRDKPLGVQQPVIVWGSTARTVKDAGTICFWTDDYRFNALWNNPEKLLNSFAGAVVEPNYSVVDDSVPAVVIWNTYKKRWLARFWQEAGLVVWVDLCVPSHFQHINLLGVPRGFGQYATAAWDARAHEIEKEYAVAKRQAAGESFTLMVYGGGKKVTAVCARMQDEGKSIVRVAHRSDARPRAGQGTRERLSKEKETD